MEPHNTIINAVGVPDTNDSNNLVQENPVVEAAVSSSGSQAQPLGGDDIFMDDGNDDDMPGLQEVSDSSDYSEAEDSDRDAHEVQMQAVPRDNDEHVPASIDVDIHTSEFAQPGTLPLESLPAILEGPRRPNNNRRSRVEDDEDDERDRRHPSQRVSNANNNAGSATSSSPQAPIYSSQSQPSATGGSTPPAQTPNNIPTQRHVFHLNLSRPNGDPSNQPFRFFQHMMVNNNGGTAATQTNNPNVINGNNSATPDAPPSDQRPPHMFEGMAISVGFHIPSGQDGLPPTTQTGGQPQETPELNGQPSNQLPPAGTIADIMTRFGIIGQTLAARGDFDGDITIPIFGNFGMGLGMPQEKEDPERARKLVDGLEEVPVGLVRRLERVGGTGGGMGEDIANGGDAGCAICWDKLLDGDGEGFGKAKVESEQDDSNEAGSSLAESTQPKIVSLPCAHVFHADCLIPWFSRPRHTTCPTCRFNIDPENLTYVSARRRQWEREQAEAAHQAEETGAPVEAQRPPGSVEPSTANNDSSVPPFTSLLDFLAAPETETQRSSLLTRLNAPAAEDGAAPRVPVAGPVPGSDLPSTTPQLLNIVPVPIPVVIPLQVPLSAVGGPAQGGTAVSENGMPRDSPRPSNTSATPRNFPDHVPTSNSEGDAPAQPQLQGQAQPLPGADFTHLLSRIMRQDRQQPAPFRALFPAPFFHLGGQQQQRQPTQAAPPSANGDNPSTGPELIPGPQPRIHMDPAVMRSPNAQGEVMRFTFDMVFNGSLPAPSGPTTPFPQQAPAAAPQEGRPTDTQDNAAGAAEDFMMMIEEANNSIDEGQRRVRNLDEVLDLLAADVQDDQATERETDSDTGGNAQPQPAETTAPLPHQQRPFFLPGFNNIGNGIHIASISGTGFSEAFSQLFGGMRTLHQQGQEAPGGQPPAQTGGEPEANAGQPQPQQQQSPPPAATPRIPFNMQMFPNLADLFGGSFQERQERPKGPWILPPPPGPTLRQRIERREQEAGLRCHDISCGVGPSDEDPFGTEANPADEAKQLSIKSKGDQSELCAHVFHGACLVSAERVALKGSDAIMEDGQVEVSCPICRGVGCVSKQEWDEGVVALE